VIDRPLELLHAIAGAGGNFRQVEAIDAVVTERRRVLLVQRTGWGKSAAYFIATRLLRDDGAGPTILVSPLLALMRNQIRMAEWTVSSTSGAATRCSSIRTAPPSKAVSS
jgi:ATP-dependent DNA helicase RecQ